MERIGILKERADHKIVALSPMGVHRLKDIAAVVVQSGAGRYAGFTDKAYREAGAMVLEDAASVTNSSNILLSYGHLDLPIDMIEGKTFVGTFNPLSFPQELDIYLHPSTYVYSLDLLPRTTQAQSMDVLSSVGSITGYQAVLLAAERSLATVPMISGAGGTLHPARFLIMGAGVAGLQAIATARRLGAVVKAYDVRDASKDEVESLGAQFIQVEGAVNDRNAGGYAVEQPEAVLQRIRERIHQEAALADVIITTARIPGKKAPLLITEEMVMDMKPGAVLIDLAAATGGNCTLTRPDETVMKNEVTILGPTGIESSCAHSTSFLLSNNYSAFIEHYLKHHDTNADDEILRTTRVIADGRMVNERLLMTLEPIT